MVPFGWGFMRLLLGELGTPRVAADHDEYFTGVGRPNWAFVGGLTASPTNPRWQATGM